MKIKEFECDALKVRIFETRQELGIDAVSDIEKTINQLLKSKECINILFAAAPSQIEILEGLRDSTSIDWTRIVGLHLDEYLGLDQNSPQLFSKFLGRYLFDSCPFKETYLINPSATDCLEECQRYSWILKQHKPDITIMGIGENGHIAFNDPFVADFIDPQMVKVVKLDNVCRQQQVNDGAFAELNDVPTHAITLTVPALLLSDYFFCVVPNERKANAVTRMLNGKIGEDCPATVLRYTKNSIMYLDKDSGAGVQ